MFSFDLGNRFGNFGDSILRGSDYALLHRNVKVDVLCKNARRADLVCDRIQMPRKTVIVCCPKPRKEMAFLGFGTDLRVITARDVFKPAQDLLLLRHACYKRALLG